MNLEKSVAIFVILCACMSFGATTCTDGIAHAVPVKDGKPPVIDAKLDDWDVSGEEAAWVSDELADKQNCRIAFMYDDAALYIAVRMGLYDHEPTNLNRPEDRYWYGDLVQLRLSTDKSLAYPLPNKFAGPKRKPSPLYTGNEKVTCVNLWRETRTGADYLLITPGANFDCPHKLNPPGSAMKTATTERDIVMETRIPWSALGCADGRNPFVPNETMAAIVDVKWYPGRDGYSTAMIYRKDPGSFAFLNLDSWGLIRFESKGGREGRGVAVEAIAENAKKAAAGKVAAGATAIPLELPKEGYLSVNIVDENGGVVKELVGGEFRKAGATIVYWDGRDQYGFPMEIGREYRWRAYMNDGVDVEYFGTVGTSGNPTYETKDGKGGWGGDHGPCVAAATDATGRYFVWHMSESGKAFVKTDFDGNVLWRSTPFVLGGYGAYTAATAAGKRLFVVFDDGTKNACLVQLNIETGNYELFPDGRGYIDLGFGGDTTNAAPKTVSPVEDRNAVGVACDGKTVYVADTAGGKIVRVDAATGRSADGIALKAQRVRGLAWHDGRLYAVTLDGEVVAFDVATGAMETIVGKGIITRGHSLCFSPDKRMFVSDIASHQVREFVAASGGWRSGRLLGTSGGRAPMGRYEGGAFRLPASIACDRTGMLIVPELAAPKVFSLIDSKTLEVKRRYFGYTAYSPSNIPDADDPLLEYYSLSGPNAFARARIPAAGGIGEPDASWDFHAAGRGEFGTVFNTMTMGEVVKAVNGRKYLVPDGSADSKDPTCPRTICLIDGDAMRPVGGVYRGEKIKGIQPLEIWTDANGDGRIEDKEKTRLEGVGGEVFTWSLMNGSIYMTANGDVYLTTLQNKVLVVPSDGFDKNGVPKWNVAKCRIAIPEIVPGEKKLFCTWREGLTGLRRDAAGNFYGVVSWSPKYATEALTKKMHTGMGHTSRFTATKFFKYGPDGRILWQAGRKATSAPKQGEILHFWAIAGLIGDEYVACASEWGPFWLYTKDGFYAGQLFDTPGKPGRGIPYLFGGEDFSGQIRYFPAKDEVWAYNSGHTFKVKGFKDGHIRGEVRFGGTVKLERVKSLDDGEVKAADIESGKWVDFREGLAKVMAERQPGALTFRFNVKDETPLVNAALGVEAIFKGGDAVGFEIGPKTEKPSKMLPEHKKGKRCHGYVRILAAVINGKTVVVGMKPFTGGTKKPQTYSTPAGGDAEFEWFDAIPGAKAEFAADADNKGYTATVSVPERFFETELSAECAVEAEVLFSGEGGRGVGTVKRLYLYSPDSSSTTMVDDTPTESRLYPADWGTMKLKGKQ